MSVLNIIKLTTFSLYILYPTILVADGFSDFQIPALDVTENVITSDSTSSAWKHTISYNGGIDNDKKLIINRITWRAQWEGLLSNNNYLVCDAKARVFDRQDMQNTKVDGSLDFDIKINSLYLQKSFDKNSLITGYHSLSLGFMDMLASADVFTPRDYSESAFTSPEDARIGQPLINWTWYKKQQHWDFILNLYPAENRYPVSNLRKVIADFLGTTNFSLLDGLPKAFEAPELLVRTRTQNGKHEQQWIIGNLLQNDPGLKQVSLVPTIIYTTEYPRFNLYAAGYSYTSGNHQLKFEAALKNGLKPIDALGTQLDEISTGLGWEYSANGDYTLALEGGISRRFLPLGATTSIQTEFDQIMARWSKTFLNETVKTTLFIGKTSPGPIRMTSLSIQYIPVDDWVFELVSTHIDANNSQYNIFTSNTTLKSSYYW